MAAEELDKGDVDSPEMSIFLFSFSVFFARFLALLGDSFLITSVSCTVIEELDVEGESPSSNAAYLLW